MADGVAYAQGCPGAQLNFTLLTPPETSESGGTLQVSIRLGGPTPTHSVTVSVTSTNPNEGIPTPAMLTFAPGGATIPQVVTVTGQDDLVADGDVSYSIVFMTSSSDPCFHNLFLPLPFLNRDNEARSVPASSGGGRLALLLALAGASWFVRGGRRRLRRS
jgi:hypothetical protein